MSKPSTKVEVYFDGVTPVNVSGYVNSVSIRRGNESQLFPDTTAGSAVIQLNNETRRFDSEYSAGPYFGNILPGRKVVVTSASTVIFTGQVDDWDYTYEVSSKRSVAVIKAVDGLAVLARQEMDEHTETMGDLPGARITSVLDRADVQWSASLRDIDTGVNVLQGDDVALFANVLQYLNTIAQSDIGGHIYVSRTGYFTFRDRHSAIAGARPSELTFSNAGTPGTIKWNSINTVNGSDLLFNRITVNREGGEPATVLSLASQATYGIRVYSTPSLLLQDADQALDAAEYLSTVYEEPAYRVVQITVELARLSSTDQNAMLALDLSSVISVAFTPNNVGSPITATLLVAGRNDDISPSQSTHLVTLNFAVGITQTGGYFLPEDATYGHIGAGGAFDYLVAF